MSFWRLFFFQCENYKGSAFHTLLISYGFCCISFRLPGEKSMSSNILYVWFKRKRNLGVKYWEYWCFETTGIFFYIIAVPVFPCSTYIFEIKILWNQRGISQLSNAVSDVLQQYLVVKISDFESPHLGKRIFFLKNQNKNNENRIKKNWD